MFPSLNRQNFKRIILCLNGFLIASSLNSYADSTSMVGAATNVPVPSQTVVHVVNVLHLAQGVNTSYVVNCGAGSLTSEQFINSVFGNTIGFLYYFCSEPYVPTNPTQNAMYGAGGTLATSWIACPTNSSELCTSQYNTVPVTQFQISTQDPLWQKTNVKMVLTTAGVQTNPTVVSSMCMAGGTCSVPSANTYEFYNNSQDSSADGNYWGRWALNAQPGLYNVALTIWRDGGWTDSCSGQVTLTPSQMGKTCYPTCSGSCANCSNGSGNMTWTSVTWTCS